MSAFESTKVTGVVSQETVNNHDLSTHNTINKQEDCAICMDKLDNNKNFAKTNCGHSFCLSCLVTSLKNNNKCPLCRTNIEEKKPKHVEALTLETCVELVKEEIDMFQYEDHLDTILMFDNPKACLKNMLRVYSIGLSKSIIAHQKPDDEWEIDEEYEDEDE